MARLKTRRRPYYTAKIMANRLFGQGGKYFTDDEVVLIKRRNMLKRFKKRCVVIYDRLFDEVDAYYREHAKFIYNLDGKNYKNRDNEVLLDFYTHQEEQRLAKENTFNAKTHCMLGKMVVKDKWYVGKVIMKKNKWYQIKQHQLTRINSRSHFYQEKIDELNKEIEECKLVKIFKKR